MNLIKKYALAGVTCLILAIVFYWFIAPEDINRQTRSAIPQQVKAVSAVLATHRPEIHLHGQVIDKDQIDIDSPLAEKVQKIFITKGQSVKAGDLLMTLDTETLKRDLLLSEKTITQQTTAIESLRSQLRTQDTMIAKQTHLLKLATSKSDRYHTLSQDGLVSLQQLEDIQAQTIQMNQQLLQLNNQRLQTLRSIDEAQIAKDKTLTQKKHLIDNIAQSDIRAYFDGRIDTIYVTEGAYVTPNERLCRLQSFSSQIEAPLTLSQYQLIKSHPHTDIIHTPKEHTLPTGQLLHLQPGQTAKMVWHTPAQLDLTPGQSVPLIILLPAIQNSMAIPSSYVQDDRLFTIHNNKLQSEPIQVLAHSDANGGSLIVSGIAPGTLLLDQILLGPKEGKLVKALYE